MILTLATNENVSMERVLRMLTVTLEVKTDDAIAYLSYFQAQSGPEKLFQRLIICGLERRPIGTSGSKSVIVDAN